jgi:aromatic-L-amino-acid decarboxylase
VLYPVVLQTVCVRHVPAGLDTAALNRHTREWVDRVNRSGVAYLTAAEVDGRWFARVSIGAIPTEREHLVATWSAMQEAAHDAASHAHEDLLD